MQMNQILTCLEQKVIILTQILNLTKQIEVRSNEPNIDLDNFLEQRGAYIVRVNKCDHLIHSLSKDLTVEEQKRLDGILLGELSEAECRDEELPILKLSKECIVLLERAAVIDKSARDAIQKQCDELRKKVNDSRQNGNQETMYGNIN